MAAAARAGAGGRAGAGRSWGAASRGAGGWGACVDRARIRPLKPLKPLGLLVTCCSRAGPRGRERSPLVRAGPRMPGRLPRPGLWEPEQGALGPRRRGLRSGGGRGSGGSRGAGRREEGGERRGHRWEPREFPGASRASFQDSGFLAGARLAVLAPLLPPNATAQVLREPAHCPPPRPAGAGGREAEAGGVSRTGLCVGRAGARSGRTGGTRAAGGGRPGEARGPRLRAGAERRARARPPHTHRGLGFSALKT